MQMAVRPLLLRGGLALCADARAPQALDILIDSEGMIAAIAPGLPADDGTTLIELAGRLIAPGLVDAHQHLDKSRTRRTVENPSGTLAGASEGYRAFALQVSREDIIARAERTLDECLARGTVAIRSHTN